MNVSYIGRLSLVALLLVLVSLLTGGIANAQGGTSTNITVTETEFKLDPAQVTVPLNTPVQVTVKNAGKVEHNLKFELPSANIAQTLFAQNLKPGETQTGTFKFTQSGTWEMYCPVDDHEGAGMKGTVMVMAAQTTGQSTAPAAQTTGQSTAPAAQGTTQSATPTAQSTAQSATPSRLPVTGAADGVASWVLAGLVLIVLGVSLRVTRRASRA